MHLQTRHLLLIRDRDIRSAMTPYKAEVVWTRGDADFADNRYSRAHQWRFDGGAAVAASASPHIVPHPLSDEAAVDPEEAFVAALASCHMLWFLSTAAKKGCIVDRYHDSAEGFMSRDERGKLWIARVVLHPHVTYSMNRPDRQSEAAIHQIAHDACFIANSVKTKVVVSSRLIT